MKKVVRMVRLEVRPNDIHKIRFAYSPLSELASSLRALADPKRHGLILPWIQRTYAAINADGSMREELDQFVLPITEQYTPHFLTPTPKGPVPTFEQNLEQLLETPRDEVIREMTVRFLREPWFNSAEVTHDPAMQHLVLEHTSPPLRDLLALTFRSTDELLERFAAFCRAYWKRIFLDVWTRTEPMLIKDIATRAKLLREEGPSVLFAKLGSGLSVDTQEHHILIEYPFEQQMRLRDMDVIVLTPSSLTWPTVTVELNPPYIPMITYPSLGLAAFAIDDTGGAQNVVTILKALADETRFELMTLLHRAPRSTQELASLLNISEAGTSKHLKQLHQAGLTNRSRQGYHVVYSPTSHVLARMVKQLEEKLGIELSDVL